MSKSPFKTAIAVANSLVTTSLFVSPVAFSRQGIIQNTFAAVPHLLFLDYHGYCYGKYSNCHRYTCFRSTEVVLQSCQQLVGPKVVQTDGTFRDDKYKSSMLYYISSIIYYFI